MSRLPKGPLLCFMEKQQATTQYKGDVYNVQEALTLSYLSALKYVWVLLKNLLQNRHLLLLQL